MRKSVGLWPYLVLNTVSIINMMAMVSLLAEMRAMEFVSRLLAEGRLDPARYKDVLLHRVDGGAALAEFGAPSKARADVAFLRRLFQLGRDAGRNWLQAHFDDIGVRSSVEKVSRAKIQPAEKAKP